MSKELLILGLVLQGEKHGYELGQYVAHTMGIYTDLKKPTIYYTLDKLEKEAFIDSKVEREGNRPERRVYRITDDGKLRFYELLRQQIAEYSPPYFSDDIGIAFLDMLSPAEAIGLIKRKRTKVKELIEQFGESPAHEGSWQQVMQHNAAHLKAEFKWLGGLIDQIRKTNQ